MTCWNCRVVIMATFHPDTFRSTQQFRAFSNAMFPLAEQQPSLLRVHSVVISFTRAYGWRSKQDNSNIPPLHRSKTAYYDILQVSPSATQSQIKTAYYKQSFIYHPDKNLGSKAATERFSEISEAYSVLGSIDLRKKYDHGILSGSDIRGSGRSSERDTTPRASGPQYHQQRPRSQRFSTVRSKTVFDFDAFFQAHYGEQLQREKEMRARKAQYQQKQQAQYRQWKLGKMMEAAVVVLLVTGGVLLYSVWKS